MFFLEETPYDLACNLKYYSPNKSTIVFGILKSNFISIASDFTIILNKHKPGIKRSICHGEVLGLKR